MKNLIIAFCSIKPKHYSLDINLLREKEYLNSLSQLFRIVPKSFDIIIVDNTIDSINNLDINFQSFLNGKTTVLINQNIGLQNKGVGEISMLKAVIENININLYEKIVYLTARHLYVSPYFFEKTESVDKSALISNPDFVYIKNGDLVKSEKRGMYNDMLFAMKKETMRKYVDYTNFEKMIKYGIGSEQNLYNFIHENNIDFEYINYLGLIRNDWQKTGEYFKFENFHIC